MGAATAGAVFYCNASVAALLFWRLAASWRPLMLQWAALERRLCATWPAPSGARWRALAIASTVLILASGTHESNWIDFFYKKISIKARIFFRTKKKCMSCRQ